MTVVDKGLKTENQIQNSVTLNLRPLVWVDFKVIGMDGTDLSSYQNHIHHMARK